MLQPNFVERLVLAHVEVSNDDPKEFLVTNGRVKKHAFPFLFFLFFVFF